MPTPAPTTENGTWHIGPALAGWLLPGLGHYLIGEKQRGMILLATIGVLWLSGMLIGGISVFDYKRYPAWFLGQSLVAETMIVHTTLQFRIKPNSAEHAPWDAANPKPNLYEPSFGRVAEQGVLYTALAGLLNLLAILDVIYRDPERTRLREEIARRKHNGSSADAKSSTPAKPASAASSCAALPVIAALFAMPITLGYTPFLDPLPLDTYWLMLLPPLVLAISLVYKTIKIDDLDELPRQALSLTGQIIAFMIMAAAGLWLLTEMV